MSETKLSDPIFSLKLAIEDQKNQYKQERRPLIWYACAAGIVLLIFLLALTAAGLLGGNPFFNGYANGITVVVGLTFACLFIGFISFEFIDGPKFFGGPQRIKRLISLRRTLDGLQTQLRIREEEQAQQRTPQERYKTQVPQVITQYQQQAKRYRNYHIRFQLLIIILSVLVTAFTSSTAFSSSLETVVAVRWIAPVLSIFVSILAGITAFFKFHDRYYNLQQTADAIEQENTALNLAIRRYKNKPHDQALVEFAEQVEQIKEEQRKRQLQLEQPSETKQRSSQ